jgi:hypothetical protein
MASFATTGAAGPDRCGHRMAERPFGGDGTVRTANLNSNGSDGAYGR